MVVENLLERSALVFGVRHEDDLLAEAKVFAKYGLREKAEDRLQELLGLQPEHLGGLALLARIAADAGDQEEAARQATEVARIARESGKPEPWNELHAELSKAGVALEEGEMSAAPAAAPPADGERFARLLEDLDDTATGLSDVADRKSTRLNSSHRQ